MYGKKKFNRNIKPEKQESIASQSPQREVFQSFYLNQAVSSSLSVGRYNNNQSQMPSQTGSTKQLQIDSSDQLHKVNNISKFSYQTSPSNLGQMIQLGKQIGAMSEKDNDYQMKYKTSSNNHARNSVQQNYETTSQTYKSNMQQNSIFKSSNKNLNMSQKMDRFQLNSIQNKTLAVIQYPDSPQTQDKQISNQKQSKQPNQDRKSNDPSFQPQQQKEAIANQQQQNQEMNNISFYSIKQELGNWGERLKNSIFGGKKPSSEVPSFKVKDDSKQQMTENTYDQKLMMQSKSSNEQENNNNNNNDTLILPKMNNSLFYKQFDEQSLSYGVSRLGNEQKLNIINNNMLNDINRLSQIQQFRPSTQFGSDKALDKFITPSNQINQIEVHLDNNSKLLNEIMNLKKLLLQNKNIKFPKDSIDNIISNYELVSKEFIDQFFKYLQTQLRDQNAEIDEKLIIINKLIDIEKGAIDGGISGGGVIAVGINSQNNTVNSNRATIQDRVKLSIEMVQIQRKGNSLERHPNFYKKDEDEEMEEVEDEDIPTIVSTIGNRNIRGSVKNEIKVVNNYHSIQNNIVGNTFSNQTHIQKKPQSQSYQQQQPQIQSRQDKLINAQFNDSKRSNSSNSNAYNYNNNSSQKNIILDMVKLEQQKQQQQQQLQSFTSSQQPQMRPSENNSVNNYLIPQRLSQHSNINNNNTSLLSPKFINQNQSQNNIITPNVVKLSCQRSSVNSNGIFDLSGNKQEQRPTDKINQTSTFQVGSFANVVQPNLMQQQIAESQSTKQHNLTFAQDQKGNDSIMLIDGISSDMKFQIKQNLDQADHNIQKIIDQKMKDINIRNSIKSNGSNQNSFKEDNSNNIKILDQEQQDINNAQRPKNIFEGKKHKDQDRAKGLVKVSHLPLNNLQFEVINEKTEGEYGSEDDSKELHNLRQKKVLIKKSEQLISKTQKKTSGSNNLFDQRIAVHRKGPQQH